MSTKVCLSGLGALGDSDTVQYDPDAVVAPQFRAGTPGRYQIDVKVTAVPISEPKDRYFDVGKWNESLMAQGYTGVTVKAATFVFDADSNPRSTGGPLDVFGWGEDVQDLTYRLTVDVAPDAGGGVSGLGAVPVAVVVVGVIVAVSLIVYWVSGQDLIVMGIKYVGKVLGVAVGAAGGAVAAAGGALIPILVIAGLALFAFTKMGGKAAGRGWSVG